MRKKSNIIVSKYIDDLDELQNNIDLKDLNEESEQAREDVDRDIHNNTTDKIEVQDNNEEEKKLTPSKCMKKMRTISCTKTKKMKMKMEMKFNA